ncbi:hypothetical protein TIFTF001_024806 [Ficus carica]|uniref:Uncharacterized protein n=1 Tax=Ficus carica TaxID=3494 RepID=A0AA88AQC7_FICCA|nr:hypothetical protein TIFTF001_024806 [Ficus carica]
MHDKGCARVGSAIDGGFHDACGFYDQLFVTTCDGSHDLFLPRRVTSASRPPPTSPALPPSPTSRARISVASYKTQISITTRLSFLHREPVSPFGAPPPQKPFSREPPPRCSVF